MKPLVLNMACGVSQCVRFSFVIMQHMHWQVVANLVQSCCSFFLWFFCNSMRNKIKYCNLSVGVRRIALKINPLAPELFFLILAHSVYKM